MKLNINFKPNISINTIIAKSPKIASVFCVFALLLMISKSIWWTINPNSTNYLTQSNTIQTNDLLAQQLINLAPFGTVKDEVIESQVAEAPKDKIVIYGVYASDPKSSIALAKINNDEAVIQVGDKFAGGIVSQILQNRIVVTINGSDISYNVSANPDTEQSDFANRADSNDLPQATTNDANNNKEQSNQDPEINNIAEQRRKMIKQFQEDNSDDSQPRRRKKNSSD